MMKLKIAAHTHVGIVREHNEDNFIINPDLSKTDWFFMPNQEYNIGSDGCLLVVADGMGGTNAGEVASKIAVDTVRNYFQGQRDIKTDKVEGVMKRVFQLVNEQITQHGIDHPETDGMGTTLTIAWLRDDCAHVAWIGDSRAYLLRLAEPPIRQISKDHSLVQQWVDEGKMNDEQAFYHPQNNIVTKSLGAQDTLPEPDYTRYPLKSHDRVLVCSDGLNGMLLDPQIEAIMNKNAPNDIGKATNLLVNAALEEGGKDNITLVLAYIFQANGQLSTVAREQVMIADKQPQSILSAAVTKGDTNWKIPFFALLSAVVLGLTWFFISSYFPSSPENKNTDNSNITVDSTDIKNDFIGKGNKEFPSKPEEKTEDAKPTRINNPPTTKPSSTNIREDTRSNLSPTGTPPVSKTDGTVQGQIESSNSPDSKDLSEILKKEQTNPLSEVIQGRQTEGNESAKETETGSAELGTDPLNKSNKPDLGATILNLPKSKLMAVQDGETKKYGFKNGGTGDWIIHPKFVEIVTPFGDGGTAKVKIKKGLRKKEIIIDRKGREIKN